MEHVVFTTTVFDETESTRKRSRMKVVVTQENNMLVTWLQTDDGYGENVAALPIDIEPWDRDKAIINAVDYSRLPVLDLVGMVFEPTGLKYKAAKLHDKVARFFAKERA